MIQAGEGTEQVTEVNGYYTVNVSALNFREQPSLKKRVQRVLPRHEKLESLNEKKEADGYTWAKVKDNKGKTGWIAIKFASEN